MRSCSLYTVANVLKKHTTSIFRVVLKNGWPIRTRDKEEKTGLKALKGATTHGQQALCM